MSVASSIDLAVPIFLSSWSTSTGLVSFTMISYEVTFHRQSKIGVEGFEPTTSWYLRALPIELYPDKYGNRGCGSWTHFDGL